MNQLLLNDQFVRRQNIWLRLRVRLVEFRPHLGDDIKRRSLGINKLLRQPPIAADPLNCPLHDPALGQCDKTMSVGALNDPDLPASRRADHGCGLCA